MNKSDMQLPAHFGVLNISVDDVHPAFYVANLLHRTLYVAIQQFCH